MTSQADLPVWFAKCFLIRIIIYICVPINRLCLPSGSSLSCCVIKNIDRFAAFSERTHNASLVINGDLSLHSRGRNFRSASFLFTSSKVLQSLKMVRLAGRQRPQLIWNWANIISWCPGTVLVVDITFTNHLAMKQSTNNCLFIIIWL